MCVLYLCACISTTLLARDIQTIFGAEKAHIDWRLAVISSFEWFCKKHLTFAEIVYIFALKIRILAVRRAHTFCTYLIPSCVLLHMMLVCVCYVQRLAPAKLWHQRVALVSGAHSAHMNV